MKSFLSTTRHTFSRELARHVAARLGESEAAVGRALSGMVPVVLCQLISGTGEGRGRVLAALISAVPGAATPTPPTMTELLGMLGSRTESAGAWGIGGLVLAEAFGEHLPALPEFMSTYARVRRQSAQELLQLVAAGLALGLARYGAQQDLKPALLLARLATARKRATAWLPADLREWPGYQPRRMVLSPRTLWAAELGRPHWLLMLATGLVMLLATAVLGTGRTTARLPRQPRATLVAGAWTPWKLLRLALALGPHKA